MRYWDHSEGMEIDKNVEIFLCSYHVLATQIKLRYDNKHTKELLTVKSQRFTVVNLQ